MISSNRAFANPPIDHRSLSMRSRSEHRNALLQERVMVGRLCLSFFVAQNRRRSHGTCYMSSSSAQEQRMVGACMFWLILIQECCYCAVEPSSSSSSSSMTVMMQRGKGRLCLTRIIHRGRPTLWVSSLRGESINS